MVSRERFDEFVGKHARFIRQILGANPVVGENRFVGLAEETADFFHEVFLSGTELLACRDL